MQKASWMILVTGVVAGLSSAVFTDLAKSQTTVPMPELVEILTPTTDQYFPNLTLASPQPDQIFSTSEVPVQVDVKRFPYGQDEATGLGLHVKVLVNNDDPIDYFNLDEPLILNLDPGTHTIRVVAARPWDRSYRNLSAFLYATFHVDAADGQNSPRFQQGTGLITVISPSGSYGAEPILLDYIVDGINLGGAQVRYTLNGESQTTTSREPIYLTGWEPGANQFVVELLSSDGSVATNADTGYNRVERTIIYQPDGEEGLAKLIRGEWTPLDVAGALGPDPFIYDEDGKPQKILR